MPYEREGKDQPSQRVLSPHLQTAVLPSTLPSSYPKTPQLEARLASLAQKYADIYVIVSPPRCSSTALSRVFWEHPSIRYYSHEPFEVVYYWNEGVDAVFEKLEQPLDLQNVKSARHDGNSLLIKEMPYQVNENFALLVAFATAPIVFLIRDPRQNITSRMEKKMEVGDNPIFPLIESGWDLLHAQVAWCKQHKTPYVIVDSADIRNHSASALQKLFAKCSLDFSEQMLSWKACADVHIDNLNGQHQHLYNRVLQSTTLLPASEFMPPIDSFPETNGFREHVRRCMKIYEILAHDPARIRVEG